MKNMTYTHKTGIVENVNGWSTFWSFLFGWMYYAVKGSAKHAIVYFALAWVTFGISCLVYPFFTRKILHKKYLLEGYKATVTK